MKHTQSQALALMAGLAFAGNPLVGYLEPASRHSHSRDPERAKRIENNRRREKARRAASKRNRRKS